MRRLAAAMAIMGTAMVLGGTLWASDATDRECLRYNDAVAKLQKSYDEATAREKAKSIVVLSGIARQRVKANDLAGADAAWKAVLGIDDSQAEARKFFETAGKLDVVLAELKQTSGFDLLGAPLDAAATGDAPPRAPAIAGATMTIAAVPSRAANLGAQKAGTAITVQFVGGSWGRKSAAADGTLRSPDAAVTPARFRLRMSSDPANSEATLAVVPAGTAQSPFTFKLETDCDNFFLCMNQDGSPEGREGEVRYRIKVDAP